MRSTRLSTEPGQLQSHPNADIRPRLGGGAPHVNPKHDALMTVALRRLYEATFDETDVRLRFRRQTVLYPPQDHCGT
jgi:hypothetical protein